MRAERLNSFCDQMHTLTVDADKMHFVKPCQSEQALGFSCLRQLLLSNIFLLFSANECDYVNFAYKKTINKLFLSENVFCTFMSWPMQTTLELFDYETCAVENKETQLFVTEQFLCHHSRLYC